MKNNPRAEAWGALFTMCVIIGLLVGAWFEVGPCTFTILLIVMIRFQISFWSGYNQRRKTIAQEIQGTKQNDSRSQMH